MGLAFPDPQQVSRPDCHIGSLAKAIFENFEFFSGETGNLLEKVRYLVHQAGEPGVKLYFK